MWTRKSYRLLFVIEIRLPSCRLVDVELVVVLNGWMCIAMLMFLCEYLGGWLVFQYNESFFQQAELYVPKKISVTMRIDEDILDWFKGQGQGYQTRINQLLRKYMDAHRH